MGVIPCGLIPNMKRKQTHFLVAAPAFFGASPILIAYERDIPPEKRETSDRLHTNDETRNTAASWTRSALMHARNGVQRARRIPRFVRRLKRLRSGL